MFWSLLCEPLHKRNINREILVLIEALWFEHRTLWLEMGPDQTRTYFWPAVNKRPTRLWSGYFLILPNDIFLTRRAKNEKFGFLGQNFQIHTQTINGWPNPGLKFLTRTHHYLWFQAPPWPSLVMKKDPWDHFVIFYLFIIGVTIKIWSPR